MTPTELRRWLRARPGARLDAAMGTALARDGVPTPPPLWSGWAVVHAPEAVRAVHRRHLLAGADMLTTASYQISEAGCREVGIDFESALDLSAAHAREIAKEGDGVLTAGSVGPFGAALADRSEYTGEYTRDGASLREFHRPRLDALARSGVDLLALETLPQLAEIEVLCDLLDQGLAAWMALSVDASGTRLADQTPLSEVVACVSQQPAVVLLGANCCSPRAARRALAAVEEAGWTGPTICYPNAAEGTPAQWARSVPRATLRGGCCGTDERHLAALGDQPTQNQ